MDQQSDRRKVIAFLAVVVPVLIGIAIVVIGHFAGHETEIAKPRESTEIEREVAAAPAATGTPAPRVRLHEGASGKSFDSSSLGREPFAVVFISTDCEAIGKFLGSAIAELRDDGTKAAVLAISADPTIDTPKAVGAYLAKHHLKGAPFHYLAGAEDELHGYWHAWGLTDPSPTCTDSVPAHLVNGSGENAGIIDLEPQEQTSILTDALAGMSK
ncbi:MAG TPA: SCO family protein [Solirubrobacterales bacterium]|jgi:cytochrome oxidase Cu insertion factor (SCO1/SenC/PrrC family)|nr:SCO family protein [Solirubrobacterales bacterium]